MNQGNFSCSACGEMCDSKEELDKHMKEAHDVEEGEVFTCSMCGATFDSKEELDAHNAEMHDM